jgi:hypothetical protein
MIRAALPHPHQRTILCEEEGGARDVAGEGRAPATREVRVAQVAREVRVLPRPLELEGGELGREAVHERAHRPGPAARGADRALRQLAVVLCTGLRRGEGIEKWCARLSCAQ